MKEIQKSIPNFENKFVISNKGNVKRLNYEFVDSRGGKKFYKECNKLAIVDNTGYYKITLTNGKNNIYQYQIHRLLAILFIPNPNNLPEVNHIDGNKLNNDLVNLEWVSKRENHHHAIKLNLKRCVSVNVSKINKEIADNIRKDNKNGLTCKQLSKIYNISYSNVYKIIKNMIWKN